MYFLRVIGLPCCPGIGCVYVRMCAFTCIHGWLLVVHGYMYVHGCTFMHLGLRCLGCSWCHRVGWVMCMLGCLPYFRGRVMCLSGSRDLFFASEMSFLDLPEIRSHHLEICPNLGENLCENECVSVAVNLPSVSLPFPLFSPRVILHKCNMGNRV